MIDELERLQGFRAHVEEPRPQATRAARAALDAVMAADLRAPRRIARRAQRPHRLRRAHRERRTFIQVTLAAAVAGVLVAVVALSGSGTPEAPTSAAAAVLNRLAVVAAAQPWAYPRAGQYMYTYSVEAYSQTDEDTGCSVIPPEHRQIWIAPDGSGMLRESFGRGAFTSAADRHRCAQHHELSMADPHRASNSWFGRGGLSDGPVNEQGLPTDTATLRALIMSGKIDGGPRTNAEAFVRVGDLLRETDASPRLRAAIYRAAATIPGVRSLGPTRDHLGRLGVGLTFHSRDGYDPTYIFNPHTSALIGETYRDGRGRLTGWAVYLVSKVVDRIPYSRPPRGSRPAAP